MEIICCDIVVPIIYRTMFNRIAINIDSFFLFDMTFMVFFFFCYVQSYKMPSCLCIFHHQLGLCKLWHLSKEIWSVIVFTATGNACKIVNDANQLYYYSQSTFSTAIAWVAIGMSCKHWGYCYMQKIECYYCAERLLLLQWRCDDTWYNQKTDNGMSIHTALDMFIKQTNDKSYTTIEWNAHSQRLEHKISNIIYMLNAYCHGVRFFFFSFLIYIFSSDISIFFVLSSARSSCMMI